MFRQAIDSKGNPYFYFATNASKAAEKEQSSTLVNFLASQLEVKPLKTGHFDNDLTSRDDILIAILSLLLLLVIHAILTSILLRSSSSGAVSNFAFSVAQFLQSIRDFRLQAFRGRGSSRKKPINRKLALVAVAVLLFSFALEAVVLLLSEPSEIQVTNRDASFTLRQPLTPTWDTVRNASETITPPCRALFLVGVRQRATRINTCLTSVPFQIEATRFRRVRDETEKKLITIVSDLHEYGARHRIEFAGLNATYTAVSYMKLSDKSQCIIAQRILFSLRAKNLDHVHKNLIAFIASAYNLDTGTQRFTEDMLNEITLNTSYERGPDISVVKMNNIERYFRVVSERFITSGTIPAVESAAVFNLAAVVFRTAIGIGVSNGSLTDLRLGSGSRGQEHAVLWYEDTRLINWLTLLVLLVVSLVVLVAVRCVWDPVSTAGIAGVVVKHCVGADGNRSPVQMADEEMKVFSLNLLEGQERDHPDRIAERERYSNEMRDAVHDGWR